MLNCSRAVNKVPEMRQVMIVLSCVFSLQFVAGVMQVSVAQEIPDYIQSAPAGEWSAIGLNSLDDVKASLADAPDGFRKNIEGIMSAWSGAAFDSKRNLLVVHGGGHRDYDGNEFYAFDISTNEWIRLNEPSLFDPAQSLDSLFPDGTPVAVHTYELLEADPGSGIVYRLARNTSTESNASPANLIWGFSVVSRQWTKMDLSIADWPAGRINGSSAWDPVNQIFWIASPDAGTWVRFGSFDPQRQEVNNYSVTNTFPVNGPVVSSLRYRNVDTPVLVSLSGSKASAWPVGSSTVEHLSLSGSLGFQDGNAVGLDYDPRRDVFWIYDEKDVGVLYQMDPSSLTVKQIAPQGATPTRAYDSNNGLYGRFRYVPDYDVVLMVNRVDGRVFMYKPTDWLATPIVRPKPPAIN